MWLSPISSTRVDPPAPAGFTVRRNYWALPHLRQEWESYGGTGRLGRGQNWVWVGYSLLQQDDISQHTEHLVEPRSLIHTLEDGAGQLCDGVFSGGPGDAVVAMFQ